LAQNHPILRALGLITLLLALVPLLFLLWQAVHLWTLDQSAAVLLEGQTWLIAGRSVLLSGGVALVCVLLSLPLAWLTHCTDLPGRRAFQILLNLPLAVPSYVSAFVVMAAFHQDSWLHLALQPLGVERMPDARGWSGAAMALMYSYPLALLTTQAALARLDPRLWEAARALGHSPRAAFWRVVVPALRPAMAGGGLLVALYTVGDFGAVALTRFQCLSYVIYLRQNSIYDPLQHEAVYLSLLLVALAVGLAVGLQRMGGAVKASLTAQAGFRPWPTIALNRWRWPAVALCSLVVTLGVVAPVAVVLGWLLRGLRLEHQIAMPWQELGISTLLSAAAALFTVAAAVIPALLGRFGSRRDGALVNWGAMTGYALPGIVVALALVSVVTSYTFSIYQTARLLLLAYLIRFLPLALGTLSEALSAQNPRLYDAARSLGCSPPQAWRRAVLPGTRAALWAGWVAVLIAVIKELPITLLLGPIDLALPGLKEPLPFHTLSTRIWSLTGDEYFSQVAPVVLVLLVVAGAGLALRPDTRKGGRR
jgi:iron(III) transport system permease protein